MTRAGLFLLAVVLGACRTSVGQAPAAARLVPLFGPVIGAEVIGGRADDGDPDQRDVLLLAGGVDVVRIGLAARRFSRVKLGIAPGEECWNLARLSDGSLWTLKGRQTVAQIAADGALVRQVALREPHFGLFDAGDRLLFQRADFAPPAPALLWGTPDDPSRFPWGTIATRAFPSLARASVAALNMITCGPSDAAERACWFPDEPAVSMVRSDGTTRRVTLTGLVVISPEELLTSDYPRRPIRDAYVDTGGALWILSSGTPPAGMTEIPGGWVLARYGSGGDAQGLARLSEAARLILRVDARQVTLLLSTGMVAQVPRW
jgi:hypothetical protein